EQISSVSASFINFDSKYAEIQTTDISSDALQITVNVQKALNRKERLDLSRTLLNHFFSNDNIQEIFMLTAEEGKEESFIELIADRDEFIKNQDKDILGAGLQQLTIVN